MPEPTTTLKHIPLESIQESKETLRKVDQKCEAYLGLVESVRLKGVMSPIGVRELVDPETGETIYGLIEGLHRFSAAKDIGLETIPAQVMACEDGDLLEAQIMANVHKVETRPVEYSKALMNMLKNNPMMSRADLAAKLAKTGGWISERLGLLKLTERAGTLVDDNKIGLSNAYALAKLPPEEQDDFIDRAMTMQPQQFAPAVNTRVKAIRDANRKGRSADPEVFVPIPMLRTRKELVTEMDNPSMGSTLCDQCKPTSAPDAFHLGVLWALQLDPRSIEVQKARDEERREEKARKKANSTFERKQKEAKEAKEKAEKLEKDLETSKQA
jgi:ParB family chromosome partitioning protein